ncbi:MAG TPA: cobalt-precorrin-5B (C(1))-methyltransferase CbiD [Polyangiaceae bacterium]|nr:cobalt-precorrin-5B (C(1))-methyltransferase CbiD [Polyangiaceae bacterium]
MTVSLGSMRVGFTTGTCAAAAAKAATMALCTGEHPQRVELVLPNGETVSLPLCEVTSGHSSAQATIRKDAGDDPDVTHGLIVSAQVEFIETPEIQFRAGPGVGTVTLPGLALPPGEPAINPGPRRQIMQAVRAITERGLAITVSIPGGEEVAHRTFNPRLGVEGGLSILGTDGRVRPFSNQRLVAALLLGLDVAQANGITEPVLVPGHIGRKNALAALGCAPVQVIETANAVGPMLEHCIALGMRRVLLFGHPGKLAKLAAGDFDTHSSRSRSALDTVATTSRALGISIDSNLPTTEAVFNRLNDIDRDRLGAAVAGAIRERTTEHFSSLELAVWLTDLAGNRLGTSGDWSAWKH